MPSRLAASAAATGGAACATADEAAWSGMPRGDPRGEDVAEGIFDRGASGGMPPAPSGCSLGAPPRGLSLEGRPVEVPVRSSQ